MSRFSSRTRFDLTPNALARRREQLEGEGRPLLDLTETNPTRCGLCVVDPSLPPVPGYQPSPLGLEAARAAVAGLYGDGVDPSRVLLSASTSEAYAWLLTLLCDAGDDVVTFAPGYPLAEYLATFSGVELRAAPLRLFAGRFELDLDAVDAAATPRTRAVLAVSPANPTGQLLAAHELDALARRCAERGWALVVDEVFHDPARHPPFVGGRPLQCLTFGLGGLSKLAGLPQLKLAWTVVSGPPALADEALERLTLLADTFLSVGSPVQEAAPRLVADSAAFRRAVAARAGENAAALRALLHEGSTWQPLPLDGGWAQTIRVPEAPGEEALCLALLDRGVVVQPGFFYDFPVGRWLVVSLLPEPATFAAGARSLADVLDGR